MSWRDEMDPNIRILSCNAQDGLGDDAQAPAIVDWLHAQNPTVAVVHEAYKADQPGALSQTLKTLHELDYNVVHQAQDTDGNPKAHGILMLAKRKYGLGMRAVPLAGRYALQADMYNTRMRRNYTVVGYTGNEENEQRRLDDITILRHQLKYSGERHALPTVLATDARTLRRRGVSPRLLYAASLATKPWPTISGAPREHSGGPFGQVERRLLATHYAATMATGRAYAAYMAANTGLGLKNADTSMKPTGRMGGLPVKLHHLLVSQDVVVKGHQVLPPPEIPATTRGHSVGSRALLAVIQLQFNHVWR